ncbi:MAG TPA: CehA/McbA family metallohydrolase [Acetobacteraceae bacterium]|nr:CehA/McbA family metallohydrolase [Acetobacteraceae bacterium]
MFYPLAGPGRFFKGNLHTHSTCSDGVHEPARVCAVYRDAGYDFLALTDHFLPRYNFPITDTRDFRTHRFTTILGAEVHAPATGLGELWHILAVGLPTDFSPTAADETGPHLAARCAAADAFTVIVHPAWYGLTVADADTITTAHAVEVYNHTSAVKTDRGDGWGLLDALLARGRRLHATAADDAHFKFNDWFGAWVMVKSEHLEPEALVAALKAGRYFSSQGPEIYGIEVDRTQIAVECSPACAVMALGRGSAGEAVFGDGLRSARLPIERMQSGGYVRVVVVDAAGRRAWSNPIWLDGIEPTA